MRLISVSKGTAVRLDGLLIQFLQIRFMTNGVEADIELVPPVDWEAMTRADKVAWVKSQVQVHLANMNYVSPYETVFPDNAAIEQAANDFEVLPNWASWTATEAEAFIHNSIFNGATLTTVEGQIDALPATIAGMKAGLKSVAAAIIQLRANQERMAMAICYLRDRSIPR